MITLDELYDDFDSLDTWNERFDYLIDLGFRLPQLPDEAKNEANKVYGCQSNVWLVANMQPTKPPTFELLGSSDAVIVNGLIAVLVAIFGHKTQSQISEIDAREVFERLGLERGLSPQRRNGLYSMVERVRQLAVES